MKIKKKLTKRIDSEIKKAVFNYRKIKMNTNSTLQTHNKQSKKSFDQIKLKDEKRTFFICFKCKIKKKFHRFDFNCF